MSETWLVFLIGVPLAILAVTDAAGIWLLRRHGAFARFVPVDDLGAVTPGHDPRGLEMLAREFQGGDYLRLLAQVMNRVSQCEEGPSTRIDAVWAQVRSGRGLLCSGMATLYFNALRVNGIAARQVYLSRALFDGNDTHVTVEVCVDGRWVIADPTFHIGYERDGELVGAQTIAESLAHGSCGEICPRFYGQVKYPPRLETYYLHWLPLFNNVFVPDGDWPRRSLWARMPPFRYWYGPRMYFQRTRTLSYDHLRFQDRLYFTLVVLFPLTLFAAACAWMVALFFA